MVEFDVNDDEGDGIFRTFVTSMTRYRVSSLFLKYEDSLVTNEKY